MSLYKQLWLSIILLMALAFSGSFIVSSLSAREYLEEQLYRKNIDNASSLALSLSAESRDDMILELFINSQFDTGHYQFINLVDMEGHTIVGQFDTREFKEAPAWLVKLFPINVKPGVAQVSSGWQQLGTLTLSSHTRFAYQQLWVSTKQLFIYFLIIAIASGVIGSILLRILTRPLDKAVAHAQAIGERRFITTNEPKTLEFRAVIRSMNKLSQHVKKMLDDESSKLEKWRQDMQHDKVTNLLNREPVLSRLKAFTKNEDEKSGGGILLIRIADLFALNQNYGRQAMDDILRHLGNTLLSECLEKTHGYGVTGRLNGSDFIVVMPGSESQVDVEARNIFDNLRRVCRENAALDVKLYAASTIYHLGEDVGAILSRTDSVLASAPAKDTDACIHIDVRTPAVIQLEVKNWKDFLSSALAEKRFTLEYFPVISPNTDLLHLEAPVRLIQDDKSLLNAGQFMPHISRLDLGTQLDVMVTTLALDEIQKNHIPIGINLSSSLLKEPRMMAEIAELIKSRGSLAEYLWLEIPEFGVFQNIDGFRTFCNLIKPFNCKIGIEHLSQEVMHIGKLHDLGLNYVKIDGSLVHEIDNTTSNQVFIRGLCTIVHSIGLTAIAEGVETANEWKSLKELGIDGGTGRYFSKVD